MYPNLKSVAGKLKTQNKMVYVPLRVSPCCIMRLNKLIYLDLYSCTSSNSVQGQCFTTFNHFLYLIPQIC